MDEQRKREKRAWESGYLTALGDVRKKLQDAEQYLCDLAMSILEKMPGEEEEDG